MKVLVACEFSGIVRDAFIRKDHDAVSCDFLPTEVPGPHYQGNVMDIINDGWDLMIAHPPCTYLAYSGNRWWNLPGREQKREDAMNFFINLYNSNIEKIAIENPHGIPRVKFRKPDQEIHPWYFGDGEMKRILLWLKNLEPLKYDISIYQKPKPDYIRNDGNKQYYCAKVASHKERAKLRSRFWQGIADAMADQWG